ncbi:MAE_28990/MAE_18760 family HEPN-like nuclease [Sphingobacterium sp. SGL-16]|uniref:MAE_28990/MAE_18760 family HEPN-like nuclease n=1 Tax=Sphingobacterium sp. SGL-16 TaxID=2710883 RepID=UPI0013ECD591|nr:MAE_28990/MAE_18760 family HEPN-like nuclease [Sphingobacterium sp. SGL-16]NGM72834.1 hypothetical protein [Sphingobacterium sp. SGL-16]
MTIENFEDHLINDWLWRKREISELILIAEQSENSVIYKSFLLLLYAHWEGYIKKSCKTYLYYLSKSEYKFCDLTDNFKALLVKEMGKVLDASKYSLTIENELSLISKLNSLSNLKISKKLKINLNNEKDKSYINTQDNLSTNVLKNILKLVGLEYKEQYDLKKSLIDIKFLGNRNSIGHGSIEIDEEDFELEIVTMKKLRDTVVLILESLRDELLEFVRNEFFLNTKGEERVVCMEKFNEELRVGFAEIESRYS